MVQISKIIIGMIFMTLIVTGLVLFFAEGVTEYPSSEYDNTSFVRLQSTFDNISAMANETKALTSNVKANDNNIYDRLGVMFTGGYTAAKTIGASYDVLNEMTNVAVDELPLGVYGTTIKRMLGVAILAVIFIAILLHFLIKSDRL